MKRLFNFKCESSGDVFERYCDDKVTITKCKCRGEAHRMISKPRYFGNSTGKSPARH